VRNQFLDVLFGLNPALIVLATNPNGSWHRAPIWGKSYFKYFIYFNFNTSDKVYPPTKDSGNTIIPFNWLSALIPIVGLAQNHTMAFLSANFFLFYYHNASSFAVYKVVANWWQLQPFVQHLHWAHANTILINRSIAGTTFTVGQF